MSQNKKFIKLILHVSEELNERIEKASAKNKLAVNSVIREALHKYLEESEKKK
jgi:predicted DNA-binding protein